MINLLGFEKKGAEPEKNSARFGGEKIYFND